VVFDAGVDEIMRDILFDAKTSGGLLIMVEGVDAPHLLERLHSAGVEDAAIIGEVIASPRERILVLDS
jgi:selenide,water dikinase